MNIKMTKFDEQWILENKIDIKKTVFLVGAGISMDSPTYLPSGIELTNYYLDMSIGKNAADRLRSVWSNVTALANKDNDSGNPIIRLEFIIGELNKVDIEFGRDTLIRGFEGFAQAKYNHNHEMLAELIRQGAKVITPNFDNCIEKALKEDFKLDFDKEIPAYTSNSATIYHYHGVAEKNYNLEYDLGATISKIKEGLPKKFQNQLKEWFEQGYSIVFCGYSASDYFDVIPFFDSIANEEYKGRAVFFNHGENYINNSFLKKIKTCLNPFLKREILIGDTADFLGKLAGDKNNTKECDTFSNRNWWKTKFAEIVSEYDEDEFRLFRITNLIRLSDQLGIAYDKVSNNGPEDINKCIDLLLRRDDLINYIRALPDQEKSIVRAVRRIYNDNNRNFKWNSLLCHEKYNKLEEQYTAACEGIYQPLDVAKRYSFDEFCKLIEKGKIDVHTFNSAVYYAAQRFTNNLTEVNGENGINNLEKAKRLLKCVNKMLNLPYYKHLYISYYIEALMMKDILEAKINLQDKDIEREEFMLELSFEISSLLHVYRVFWSKCKKNMLLFKNEKKMKYLNQVLKNIINTKRIGKCIGIKYDLIRILIGLYFKY